MKNINEINEKIIIDQLKNELNLIENKKDFFSLKNKYLNSNSFLKKYFSILKEINDANQKKEIGKKINKIVEKIKFLLKEKEEFLNSENKENKEKFDFTLPIYNLFKKSKKNILIYTLEKMINFFSSLGFKIIDDNEIVSSKENFDFLNFPENHPAKSLNDTFFFEKEKKYLLRTHCTTASIKNLSSFLKKNTNFKREINYGLINFGNVFRRDEEDNTHSHQFMQLDGIFASKKTNFSQLKWLLTNFCKKIFKEKIKIKILPSFFPFTTPSLEIFVNCLICENNYQNNCHICKNSKWVEILGAGMLNENVKRNNALPKNINIIAFGIGVERIAMLKYKINDIRKFYEE